MKYIIKVPEKYETRKKEVLEFFGKNPPEKILEKFTGRVFQGDIVIEHKELGYGADFQNDEVQTDFEREAFYIFLCTVHELAHILLKQDTPWFEYGDAGKIISEYKNYQYEQYKYDFQYAIEQTIVFMIQSACENEAGLRPVKYDRWQETFESNGVKALSLVIWPEFLNYLENIKKYKMIDEWILEVLKKYFY